MFVQDLLVDRGRRQHSELHFRRVELISGAAGDVYSSVASPPLYQRIVQTRIRVHIGHDYSLIVDCLMTNAKGSMSKELCCVKAQIPVISCLIFYFIFFVSAGLKRDPAVAGPG